MRTFLTLLGLALVVIGFGCITVAAFLMNRIVGWFVLGVLSLVFSFAINGALDKTEKPTSP